MSSVTQDNRAIPGVPICLSILSTAAAILVAVRLYTRFWLHPRPGVEDYFIIPAFVCQTLRKPPPAEPPSYPSPDTDAHQRSSALADSPSTLHRSTAPGSDAIPTPSPRLSSRSPHRPTLPTTSSAQRAGFAQGYPSAFSSFVWCSGSDTGPYTCTQRSHLVH